MTVPFARERSHDIRGLSPGTGAARRFTRIRMVGLDDLRT
jgi:hypothetical protein